MEGRGGEGEGEGEGRGRRGEGSYEFDTRLECVVLSLLQSAVKGNVEALATVTGIVDGTGSVGAAIGQVCYQLSIYTGIYRKLARV